MYFFHMRMESGQIRQELAKSMSLTGIFQDAAAMWRGDMIHGECATRGALRSMAF